MKNIAKSAKFWPFELKKATFKSIQPNPSYDICHPKEASCQENEKVTEALLRLAHSSFEGDADDDGKIGIWKGLCYLAPPSYNYGD